MRLVAEHFARQEGGKAGARGGIQRDVEPLLRANPPQHHGEAALGVRCGERLDRYTVVDHWQQNSLRRTGASLRGRYTMEISVRPA